MFNETSISVDTLLESAIDEAENPKYMQDMNATHRIKIILRTLGFTPKILAKTLNISDFKARRILSNNGTIYLDEAFDVASMLGHNFPDFLLTGAK